VVKRYGARNVRVVLATNLMGRIRADTGAHAGGWTDAVAAALAR
jgi:hypothetical protein